MAKKLKAIFYRTETGKEPVREWILTLSTKDKKIIGADIKTIEFGFPIGMPVCKKLTNKIYKVRSNLTSNKIARILFAVNKNEMILLHGFIKKTQKTNKNDIDLTNERLKLYIS